METVVLSVLLTNSQRPIENNTLCPLTRLTPFSTLFLHADSELMVTCRDATGSDEEGEEEDSGGSPKWSPNPAFGLFSAIVLGAAISTLHGFPLFWGWQ